MAEAKARSIARRRRLVDRAYQLIDYSFLLLYGLLAVRLALGVLGASETAGFVQFMRALTQPFYGPFVDIVPSVPLSRGVLEVPILICMMAFLLLHLAVRGLVHVIIGTRRSV